MSIRVMAAVWDDERIARRDKLVALALADHADDEGCCYPSIDRIARKAGLSRRSVIDTLKRIEAQGIIQVDHNAGPSGTNVYRIVGCKNCTGAKTARVQNSAPKLHPNRKEPSESITTPRARDRFTDEEIESIYKTYPRKVGKRKAVEEIRHALSRIAAGHSGPNPPPADPAAWLESRTEEFASSPAGKRGTLTPHPSTWFHQDRFDDDPAEWQRKDQDNRSNDTERPLSARQYAGLSTAEKLRRGGFIE